VDPAGFHPRLIDIPEAQVNVVAALGCTILETVHYKPLLFSLAFC
jgi:hypothetical protein